MHFVRFGLGQTVNDDTLSITCHNTIGGDFLLSARDSTGKHYFEGVQTYLGSSYLGVYESRSLTTPAFWIVSRNSAYSNVSGTVALDTLYAPFRAMVAYDLDTGNLWFGRNGVWANSGNPATGANPTYTGITGRQLWAGGSLNSVGATTTIYVDPGDWLYAPTGFSPPTEFSPLVKTYMAKNPIREGIYGIEGVITEFRVPGAYRVRLHDEATGFVAAETWSDSNGAYAFTGLSADKKYVIAFDHTDPLQTAAIMDKVVPS